MPAIEFSRLRTKIELLGKVFSSPEQFNKELIEFYISYSDLTFQVNDVKYGSSSYLAYRTPVVLNRELENTFKPRACAEPETALQIIDILWKNEYIEPRQFAAALLGALPIGYSPQVLERIQQWSSAGESQELISYLHTKSTQTIRLHQPELWIESLNQWIQSKDIILEKMAVLGLLPFVNDPDFTNLPIVYDFLYPLLSNLDPHLTFSLLMIIKELVNRSETETIYFMKQVIRSSSNPDFPRFVRRSLPYFSQDAQISLKSYLREHTSIK